MPPKLLEEITKQLKLIASATTFGKPSYIEVEIKTSDSLKYFLILLLSNFVKLILSLEIPDN